MSLAVLKIRNKPIPYVIEKVDNVVTSMTGNSNFTTPSPALATVTTEKGKLSTYYQNALSGDRNQKLLMHNQKKVVFNLMTLLTGYVQTASGGDDEKIISAGFLVKAIPTPEDVLPPPGDVRAVFGDHPGELIVRWAGVKGRDKYMVEMSPDPASADTWVEAPHGLTGKTRLVVSGLLTGAVYWFRVFAIGTQGPSGPSDPASHMVP